MVAVIIGTDKTVECPVVVIRKPVFKLGRLFTEPVIKTVLDFIYLRIGKLYGLGITHFYFFQFAVNHLGYLLGNIVRGVVHGVLHQSNAIESTAL